jgi:hypothetical protein
MGGMDKILAVPASALLDLLDISERALEQLELAQPNDALNYALRGSLDRVRIETRALEPQ